MKDQIRFFFLTVLFLFASLTEISAQQKFYVNLNDRADNLFKVTLVPEKLIEQNPHIKASLEELTQKKSLRTMKTFRGKGCAICHQSGYHGRVGVFEVLLVDEPIREAIMAQKNADDIRALALKQGMTTMIYDGLRKMLAGVTTLEEILRVTKE